MQFGIRAKHHDHDYVDRRGGWEFFTHLRGGKTRADFRRQALARAIAIYRGAARTGTDEFELCAAATLVLQRAAFAVEDFAGLLHALATGQDHWQRLTSTKVPDLNAVFQQIGQALETGGPALDTTVIAPFCLGNQELLEAEPNWSPEEREAALVLVNIYAERWLKQMRPVMAFWRECGRSAKATMHGYPVVAARHLLGPPGAGAMAVPVSDPGVPFCVVLETSTDGSTTELRVVQCDPLSVEAMNFAGRAAADLYQDLAGQQARSIDTGYAVMVPGDKLERLNDEQQAILRGRFER